MPTRRRTGTELPGHASDLVIGKPPAPLVADRFYAKKCVTNTPLLTSDELSATPNRNQTTATGAIPLVPLPPKPIAEQTEDPTMAIRRIRVDHYSRIDPCEHADLV
jgi:hypothetical protein